MGEMKNVVAADVRKSGTAGSKSSNTARKPKTLSDKAYTALAELIRTREIVGGEPLVELQLAKRLGVSRTPLRQAMQRLEGEGLLRKGANRSYLVRQVDLKEYLQSLRVREVLEPEAAALAIDFVTPEMIAPVRENLIRTRDARPYDMLAHWRSDDEVHDLFIRNCRNEVLTGILVSLRGATQLFEIERLAERLAPDSSEHERILNAMAEGDARGARQAVTTHLRSLFKFAVRSVG